MMIDSKATHLTGLLIMRTFFRYTEGSALSVSHMIPVFSPPLAHTLLALLLLRFFRSILALSAAETRGEGYVPKEIAMLSVCGH